MRDRETSTVCVCELRTQRERYTQEHNECVQTYKPLFTDPVISVMKCYGLQQQQHQLLLQQQLLLPLLLQLLLLLV